MNFKIKTTCRKNIPENFIVLKLISLICICLLVILTDNASALSGPEHSKEMTEMIGLDFSTIEGQRLLKLINGFVIDEHKAFRLKVLENCKTFKALIDSKDIKSFTMGYSHRIFFHWGAGGRIPFNKPPLKDYFNGLEKKGVPKEEIERTKQMMIDEWRKRRIEMFEAFESLLVKVGGLSRTAAKSLSKPLSTLLVNIHILGDYKTKHIKGLPGIENLRDDIVKVLESRVFRNDPKALELINRLIKIDCSDAVRAAKEIRSVLKEMLPAAIESKLGKTLSKLIVKSAIAGSYMLRAASTYSKLTAKIKNPRVRTSVNTAAFVGSVSAVINLYYLSNGQITINNALTNTMEDTGLSFGSMYISEGVIQVMKNNKYALTILTNQKAAGALINFGIATFIFDESLSVFNFVKGKMSTDRFVEETGENLVKSAGVGAASYCAVVLGATPGGFIVIGVSLGSYFIMSKAVSIFQEYSNSKYLFVEDVYPFLPLSMQQADTIWIIKKGKSIWDNSFIEEPASLWEHRTKDCQDLWSIDKKTIWE